MPVYTFEDVETSERLELLMPMSEAPAWGDLHKHEGRILRRLPDPPTNRVKPTRHFVSQTLPRNYKHHKGKFNAKGQPVFDSQREVDEVLARSQGEEPTAYYVED